MNGDYGGDGAGKRGRVRRRGRERVLAQDSSEELVFGRVDPVASCGVGTGFCLGIGGEGRRRGGRSGVRICARDAGYHSFVRERPEAFG